MARSQARKFCKGMGGMRSRMSSMLALVIIALVASGSRPSSATFAPLSSTFHVGFYSQSCPPAESIVSNTLSSSFSSDIRVPARILRMLFHECFVTGCDGSLLVNATAANPSPEKTASPNLSVAGYDVIDSAKATLEAACPGIVSCADIQALMARDAINTLGGGYFQMPTGRLDTQTVTTAGQAVNTLPLDTYTADQVVSAFQAQGFSTFDTVTLLGAHTVGATFCQTFSYRLYNYQNTGQPTPFMDPNLVTNLQAICPNPNTPASPDPAVALDQGSNSENTIDNSYYQQLLQYHGILDVDQNLALSTTTGPIVSAYAGNSSSSASIPFVSNFISAVTKMSTLNIITAGTGSGSIRQNCATLN